MPLSWGFQTNCQDLKTLYFSPPRTQLSTLSAGLRCCCLVVPFYTIKNNKVLLFLKLKSSLLNDSHMCCPDFHQTLDCLHGHLESAKCFFCINTFHPKCLNLYVQGAYMEALYSPIAEIETP